MVMARLEAVEGDAEGFSRDPLFDAHDPDDRGAADRGGFSPIVDPRAVSRRSHPQPRRHETGHAGAGADPLDRLPPLSPAAHPGASPGPVFGPPASEPGARVRTPRPGSAAPVGEGVTPGSAAFEDALRRFERTVAETNQVILDALKSRSPVPAPPAPRRTVLVAASSTLLAVALAGGVAVTALSGGIGGGRGDQEDAARQRLRAEADSWAYLWRTSSGFRDCWTSHARTGQPQRCTITLGASAPGAVAGPAGRTGSGAPSSRGPGG